jgi:hypothetical protein
MPQITLSTSTHSGIALLARAWSISEDRVVARLLEAFQATEGDGGALAGDPGEIRVHARYKGTRVDGLYHVPSGRLDIIDGPAAGQSFKTPSGAAIAVVQALNPRVNPNRNGWSFWMDEEGRMLQIYRLTNLWALQGGTGSLQVSRR